MVETQTVMDFFHVAYSFSFRQRSAGMFQRVPAQMNNCPLCIQNFTVKLI